MNIEELSFCFSEKGIKHTCEIKISDTYDLENIVDFLNNSKSDFHILLRKSNSDNGVDFTLDHYDPRLLLDSRESMFQYSEDYWYDMVIEKDKYISISDEPVGLMLDFDNVLCIDAIRISDEILSNVEKITGCLGVLWLVINKSIINVPMY